jgi:uncharacterized protein YggE
MSRPSLLPLGFLALVVALDCPGPARAQVHDESGTVSGNGVVTISRAPETMRVQIALQGKGADLKAALAAVKTRADAARKQLTGLGADKDSIKVDGAKIAAKNNQQQRQMMMMQRMKQGNKASKKPKTPDPVLVSAMLTAEWKLDSKSADDLLVAVHGLQEKIKAADLGGTKEAEKLSPEQEELLEEMEANQYQYGSDDEPKPGEPIFIFVSRISDTERDKALAEAFQKAKVQAARLAKAAGAELGELKSLSGHSTSPNEYNSYGRYNQFAYQALQMARAQAGIDDDEGNDTEALGAEPGPVKINVTVTAAFDLKRK